MLEKEAAMRISKVHQRLSGFIAAAVTVAALSLAPYAAAYDKTKPDLVQPQDRLVERVRHELVMLPWYGVFDNLSFEIRDNDTVVLTGQVTRPTLKSDAGGVVNRIEGVHKVVNQIEVLPLSRFDDQLRFATYRAIYSRPGLDRYALRAIPAIHILVKNGNITLTGVVASEGDKNLAGIIAQGIPLSFSVTNNLTVQKGA
jgi:hyperosmotically inducible protein